MVNLNAYQPRSAFGRDFLKLLRDTHVPESRIEGLTKGFPSQLGINPWPRFSHKTGPGVDGAPVSHRY